MSLQPTTLWDLLEETPTKPGGLRAGACPAKPARPLKRKAIDIYHALEREMLTKYRIRVRKWRSSSSGVAWQVTYRDGTISRLIESPRPRGPISVAIFLHEIGHHAIGFNTYKIRCIEEMHAWRFALDEMERRGLNITPRLRQRVCDALNYAIAKARRRGMKRVPAEVLAFIACQERQLDASVGPRRAPTQGRLPAQASEPGSVHPGSAGASNSASTNARGSNG